MQHERSSRTYFPTGHPQSALTSLYERVTAVARQTELFIPLLLAARQVGEARDILGEGDVIIVFFPPRIRFSELRTWSAADVFVRNLNYYRTPGARLEDLSKRFRRHAEFNLFRWFSYFFSYFIVL